MTKQQAEALRALIANTRAHLQYSTEYAEALQSGETGELLAAKKTLNDLSYRMAMESCRPLR